MAPPTVVLGGAAAAPPCRVGLDLGRARAQLTVDLRAVLVVDPDRDHEPRQRHDDHGQQRRAQRDLGAQAARPRSGAARTRRHGRCAAVAARPSSCARSRRTRRRSCSRPPRCSPRPAPAAARASAPGPACAASARTRSNSRVVSSRSRPARVTIRRPGSIVRSPTNSGRVGCWRCRRTSACSRAASSATENGLTT